MPIVLRVDIRPAERSDYPLWADLWAAYLVFYETVLPDSHTEALWERIHDPTDPIECLVATGDDGLIGIVQFLPHASTWTDSPVCYLQDLYVVPEERGQGVGAALVAAVKEISDERAWAGVYWQTAEDNAAARRLYDHLTGGASGFIVYELD